MAETTSIVKLQGVSKIYERGGEAVHVLEGLEQVLAQLRDRAARIRKTGQRPDEREARGHVGEVSDELVEAFGISHIPTLTAAPAGHSAVQACPERTPQPNRALDAASIAE